MKKWVLFPLMTMTIILATSVIVLVLFLNKRNQTNDSLVVFTPTSTPLVSATTPASNLKIPTSTEPITYLNTTEREAIVTNLASLVETQNPKAALDELSNLMENNPKVLRSCHGLVHEIAHMAFQKYGFGAAIEFQNDLCGSGYLHGIVEENFSGNDANGPVLDPGHHATGNKFYNNTVLNSAENNGIFRAGLLNIGSQMGMEIYGNTMVQNQRPDFKNGWSIKPWDGGWLKGVKIYNNTLTKAPYKGTFPGQNGDWDFCVELYNIEGVEIYNNNIQGSIDINFSRKGTYAFSAWIHHNNLGRSVANVNFESGIVLEFRTESMLIENNILNNVSSGVQFNTRAFKNDGGFPNPGGGTPPGRFSYLLNNTIRNNLFSNLYFGNGTGTGTGIVIVSEGSKDQQINGLNIYNNTFAARTGAAPIICLDFSNQENGSSANVNIRNNIAVGFTYAWLAGSSPNTAMSNVVVTHNDAFNCGSGNTPVWPAGNPAGYTYNNNMSVNPLFVSATDFRLQLTSPVIDKGIDIGLPFSGNTPDMGYAEYGLGGPVPIKLMSTDAGCFRSPNRI